VAVVRGGRGRPLWEVCPLFELLLTIELPPIKLVARYLARLRRLIAVFTDWHRIVGVKLHHSLNHALRTSSGILGPQIQIWPPRCPPQTVAARNARIRICVTAATKCHQVWLDNAEKDSHDALYELACTRCCSNRSWSQRIDFDWWATKTVVKGCEGHRDHVYRRPRRTLQLQIDVL